MQKVYFAKYLMCSTLILNFLFQNLMNNFPIDQLEVAIARGVLLFQLITIFPLITYIWRSQLMCLFKIVENWTSIILVNTVAVMICIFFAIFMPRIGTIIRFTGAFCGFIMIFLLPCCCKLVALKHESNLLTWKTFAKIYWKSVCLHAGIICLGLCNMIAQFVF